MKSRSEKITIRVPAEWSAALSTLAKQRGFPAASPGRRGGVPALLVHLIAEVLGVEPPPDYHDARSAYWASRREESAGLFAYALIAYSRVISVWETREAAEEAGMAKELAARRERKAWRWSIIPFGPSLPVAPGWRHVRGAWESPTGRVGNL